MKRKINPPRCVIRGGSWDLVDPGDLAASARDGDDPTARFSDMGFRLMRKL